MEVVNHDQFLKQLADLFASKKEKGTIWLTHKRLLYDGEDEETTSREFDSKREFPCLLRVTDGKQTKFFTKIDISQLERFHAAYGSLLKASMTTLRKRDKKREKQRAEQAAQRRKKLEEPIIVSGPKRGNGRRKRQRRIKAALKQEQLKQRIKQREEAKAKLKSGLT